jgi:shikimate kinase
VGNVRGQLMNLMSERAEHYASVALWTVDTSSLSPEEVADLIETHMGAK